jgi:hypothetical protein
VTNKNLPSAGFLLFLEELKMKMIMIMPMINFSDLSTSFYDYNHIAT